MKCSVLISVFNGQKFLSGFFNDLLRQDIINDVELLFLNASPDPKDSDDISEFIKKYPKLKSKHISLDSSFSVYEAWNFGIDVSSSDILTNWNIDDRRALSSLRLQIEDLENSSEVDLNYGQTITTEVPNEIFEFTESTIGFAAYEPSTQSMLKNNSPHCLPVWRKSLHDRFGVFDEHYKYCADYDMWMRAIVGGAKFKKLPINTGLYYRNPEGLSSGSKTLKKALEEVSEIRKKYQ